LHETSDLLNIIPRRSDVLDEPRMSRTKDTNLQISFVANVKAMFLRPRRDARVCIKFILPLALFILLSDIGHKLYPAFALSIGFLFPATVFMVQNPPWEINRVKSAEHRLGQNPSS